MSRLSQQFVLSEIAKAIAKLRIIDSDTIEVADGDHPMQPSVIGGGTGHVTGPALANDNALVVFDGTTGKLVKDPGFGVAGDSILIGATREITNVRVISGGEDPFPLFITIMGNAGLALSTANITSGPAEPGDITLIAGNALDAAEDTFGADIFMRPGKGSGIADDGVVEIRDADDNIIFTTGPTLNAPIKASVNLDMDGNDIIGLAPKESHIDLLALATEHAFS